MSSVEPPPIAVWPTGIDDLAAHYAVRHRVFVLEQRIMEFTDIDAHDADPATVHVLAAEGDRVAGCVRLYRLEDGWWRGDRLAVLPNHRSSTVGAELVRFAVTSAAAAGGAVMEAQIQLPNVRFFKRLGWTAVGDPAPYAGFHHQLMHFDLTTAAPRTWPPRPAALHLETPDGYAPPQRQRPPAAARTPEPV